jgi:hypothetical protein
MQPADSRDAARRRGNPALMSTSGIGGIQGLGIITSSQDQNAAKGYHGNGDSDRSNSSSHSNNSGGSCTDSERDGSSGSQSRKRKRESKKEERHRAKRKDKRKDSSKKGKQRHKERRHSGQVKKVGVVKRSIVELRMERLQREDTERGRERLLLIGMK